MPDKPEDIARRSHAEDLRGASRLVIDATKKVTDVVESMHRTIGGGPELLGRPLEGPVRLVTGVVYGSIRGVTHLVGAVIDLALGQLAPLLGESVPGPERAALVAALNGVIGDYLVETNNPLATEMAICVGGQALPLEAAALARAVPDANGKLVVFLHGSSMNDQQWTRAGHDHGAALARDLGIFPVYLRYNSGLHISTNGRAFAEMLERLTLAWPAPITELVLVGHSMGGLVARSACHVADERGHAWRGKLTKLVCLASPHHGAPLERGGNMLDLLLGVSRYSAPLSRLGRLRSAGVTDLRYGCVLDEHWEGRDRFAHGRDPRRRLVLPEGVACYALAATLTPAAPDGPGPTRTASLRSDGLVPVDSALGRHTRAELALGFPEGNQWIAYGTGHLEVLARKDVYETLRGWLSTG
jgi:pimeloyl-ACP methyl ester carboxylesterase